MNATDGTRAGALRPTSVAVLPFGPLREIVGRSRVTINLDPSDSTVGELWGYLVDIYPRLAPLRSTTRTARNGAFVDDATRLADEDEVALLPPFGGG